MTEENKEIEVVQEGDIMTNEASTEEIKNLLMKGFEIGTGAVMVGKQGLLTAALKGIQGVAKHKNLSEFKKEFVKLREQGKIKEDFINDVRSRGFRSLQEVLRMIDREDGVTDQEKLELIKRLFFFVVEKDIEPNEELIRYQLFQIALKLSSNDLLVLSGCYKLHLNREYTQNNAYESWATNVSKEIGFGGMTGIVELSEEPLMKYKLLGKRTNSDGSGISRANTVRMTPLGAGLAKLLAQDPLAEYGSKDQE